MQQRWTAFAHGESPDAVGSTPWEPYSIDEGRSTLVIDHQDRLVPDLDGSLRAAWGDDVLTFH